MSEPERNVLEDLDATLASAHTAVADRVMQWNVEVEKLAHKLDHVKGLIQQAEQEMKAIMVAREALAGNTTANKPADMMIRPGAGGQHGVYAQGGAGGGGAGGVAGTWNVYPLGVAAQALFSRHEEGDSGDRQS